MRKRPSPLKDVPAPDAIASELILLATTPRGYTIIDKCPLLQGLDGAQKCMPAETADDEDFADGVRKYLSEAVGRTDGLSRQNRIIVEVVLGVGDKKWRKRDWREQSAKARREEAAKLFRGKEGGVKGETLRQLYERPALDELAVLLCRDEQQPRRR